jgi:hypothetical protein
MISKFIFSQNRLKVFFCKFYFETIKDFIKNSKTMILLVHNYNGIIIKKSLPSHFGEKDQFKLLGKILLLSKLLYGQVRLG